MVESDNDIMYRVKAGQLDDLTRLYDRYQSPLNGFFIGMTRDKNLSADLIQNVFYRILKYREQFKGGVFKTWLFHIARNVLNDQYKKKISKVMVNIDGVVEQFTDDHWADHVLHKSEELRLLDQAMASLPEDKREILLLSKYQDKNYKEIGELLGCTEGTVKVRVFRALNELKNIYHQIEK